MSTKTCSSGPVNSKLKMIYMLSTEATIQTYIHTNLQPIMPNHIQVTSTCDIPFQIKSAPFTVVKGLMMHMIVVTESTQKALWHCNTHNPCLSSIGIIEYWTTTGISASTHTHTHIYYVSTILCD